jgi:hypothetical protein
MADAYSKAMAGSSGPSNYGGLTPSGQYAAEALPYTPGVSVGPPTMNQATQMGWGYQMPGAMDLSGATNSRWVSSLGR